MGSTIVRRSSSSPTGYTTTKTSGGVTTSYASDRYAGRVSTSSSSGGSSPSRSVTMYQQRSRVVPDVDKMRAFAEKKKKEAEIEKQKTEGRISEFEAKRQKQLLNEEYQRKVQLTGKDRTKKQPSQLTQKRTSTTYEAFQSDVRNYQVKAKQDVQKKTRDEYAAYNKTIDKINKEIEGYKPTKVEYYSVPVTMNYTSTKVEKVSEPDWNKISVGEIRSLGYENLSALKKGYKAGDDMEQRYKQTLGQSLKIVETQPTISSTRSLIGSDSSEIAQIVGQGNVYADITRQLRDTKTVDYNRVRDVAQANRVTSISGLQFPVEENNRIPEGDWLGKYSQELQTQTTKFEREVSPIQRTNFFGREIVSPNPQYLVTDFIQGTLEGVTGVGLMVQDVVFKGGKQTSQSLERIFKDPQGIHNLAIGMGNQLVTRPARFTGQLVGAYGTFKVAGKVASTSVKIGQYGLGKVTAIGKTKIGIESLVPKEVLSGSKRFPEFKGSGAELIKETKKGTYTQSIGKGDIVLHGTDWRFTPFQRTVSVGAGRGLEKAVDVPVMYTSGRGLSLHFLRFGNQSSGYSLFPNLSGLKATLRTGSPKIYAFYPSSLQRIPSAFRTSLGKAQSYFGKYKLTGQKSVGKVLAPKNSAIPTPAFEFGLKAEAELGLAYGGQWARANLSSAWQKLTGFRYYTQYKPKGAWFTRNVPIYEAVPGVVKTTGKVSSTIKSLGSAYDVYGYSSGAYGVTRSLISWTGLASVGSVAISNYSKPKSYILPSNSQTFSTGKSKALSRSSIRSFSNVFSSSGTSTSKTSSGSVSSFGSFSSYTPSYNVSSYTPSYISKVSLSKVTPSYTSSVTTSRKGSIPKTIPRRKEESYSSYPSGTPLYNSYVRKDSNTKWRKVTNSPVPMNRAYNIGFFEADNTPAVSVKLERAGKAKQYIADDGFLNSYKFKPRGRKSRVPGKPIVYQEMKRFRIDTIGEKQSLKQAKRNNWWF